MLLFFLFLIFDFRVKYDIPDMFYEIHPYIDHKTGE